MLRVLQPSNPLRAYRTTSSTCSPSSAVSEASTATAWTPLRLLNAQNQYNLTIIEPSFGIDSWYADNPTDPNLQYETFMTQDLVPWVTQNLATTGHELNWLIGFSKSGIGGEDLILKHPDLFAVVATWDFPAD